MEDPYHWDERVEAWVEVASSPAFLALRDRICAEAHAGPEDRVVDLGAGTGLITLALAPHVESVTAVDIAPQMLEHLDAAAATDGIDNITPIAADIRMLPLADECATLVVSNYTFHHLVDSDKEIALSEVRRILAPGGRLVLCDMMFALSLEPRDRALVWHKLVAIARRGPAGLIRIARNAGRVAAGRWEHPCHPETWERMLLERSFEDVRVELLDNEAGLATARRPALAEVPDERDALARSGERRAASQHH